MIGNRQDFLASFDYFAARHRCTSLPDRDARVVQWGWAWPDLAPHITRLLYDAEHHVRYGPGDDHVEPYALCVVDAITGKRSVVQPSSSFDPPLTAFEAAIVFHAVIRPNGPPLDVTFYRGDGTYVVNGVIQRQAPILLGEKILEGDFPCDEHRAVRVRKWILRTRPAELALPRDRRGPLPDNYPCCGPSDRADADTASTTTKETAHYCGTCGYAFNDAEEAEKHPKCMPSCGPPASISTGCQVQAVKHRTSVQQRDVAAVSFRVQERHLLRNGNPIPGSPIRVCWDGVPIFVMYASEWMWCREEIAAIVNRVPFHRCYRVAELPFVVFHEESPGVPQLSACFDDVWSLRDVFQLLAWGRGDNGDARQLLPKYALGLRSQRFAFVVAGPHIGTSDEYLHISLLIFTSRGSDQSRVYLHCSSAADRRCVVLPNLPIDAMGFISWDSAIFDDQSTSERQDLIASADEGIPVVPDTESGIDTGHADKSAPTVHSHISSQGDREVSDGDTASQHDRPERLSNSCDSLSVDRLRSVLTVARDALVRQFVDEQIEFNTLTTATQGPLPAVFDIERKRPVDRRIEHFHGSTTEIPRSPSPPRAEIEWPTATGQHSPTAKVAFLTGAAAVRAGSSGIDSQLTSSDARFPRHSEPEETATDGDDFMGSLPRASTEQPSRTTTGRESVESRGGSPLLPEWRVPSCHAFIYVQNIGRHMEQDRFRDDKGLREALFWGAGQVCRSNTLGCADSSCSYLHALDHRDVGDLPLVAELSLSSCTRRRPLATWEAVLVLDYGKHFDVSEFVANPGLQNAMRFGRGKMCRSREVCTSTRTCFFLHFAADAPVVQSLAHKRRLRRFRSIFVRNIYSRLNVSQFVHDQGLHRALSVGEGYVCTGHERHRSCRLLHFDHRWVFRALKECSSIEEMDLFANQYGLGRIVTPLRGVNASATKKLLAKPVPRQPGLRRQRRLSFARRNPLGLASPKCSTRLAWYLALDCGSLARPVRGRSVVETQFGF